MKESIISTINLVIQFSTINPNVFRDVSGMSFETFPNLHRLLNNFIIILISILLRILINTLIGILINTFICILINTRRVILIWLIAILIIAYFGFIHLDLNSFLANVFFYRKC
jgi:hypothetical protein